jgi:hypothetical protein
MVAAIYVRRTQTRSRMSGDSYVTHRLVRSNDTTLDGEALWRTYVQLTDHSAA